MLTNLLHNQPKVVTDMDEHELAKRIDQLERENMEVDGDADSDADEDGSIKGDAAPKETTIPDSSSDPTPLS